MLRNNGLTEARFLDMMRGDLAQRQLLDAVSAGAATPEVAPPAVSGPVREAFGRHGGIPVRRRARAAGPAEADLQRWYDNHPEQYSAPEYRRIKAVVLSPQTLAKDIAITDEDLHAAYEQHKAEYVKPDEALGRGDLGAGRGQGQGAGGKVAGRRRLGGDAEGGAGRRRLGDRAGRRDRARVPRSGAGARRCSPPTPDTVTGPAKGALGWYVVRVTKVTPGSEQSFEQVKDELREQVLAARRPT